MKNLYNNWGDFGYLRSDRSVLKHLLLNRNFTYPLSIQCTLVGQNVIYYLSMCIKVNRSMSNTCILLIYLFYIFHSFFFKPVSLATEDRFLSEFSFHQLKSFVSMELQARIHNFIFKGTTILSEIFFLFPHVYNANITN